MVRVFNSIRVDFFFRFLTLAVLISFSCSRSLSLSAFVHFWSLFVCFTFSAICCGLAAISQQLFITIMCVCVTEWLWWCSWLLFVASHKTPKIFRVKCANLTEWKLCNRINVAHAQQFKQMEIEILIRKLCASCKKLTYIDQKYYICIKFEARLPVRCNQKMLILVGA